MRNIYRFKKDKSLSIIYSGIIILLALLNKRFYEFNVRQDYFKMAVTVRKYSLKAAPLRYQSMVYL